MTNTIASLLLWAGIAAPDVPPQPPIFGGQPAAACSWPSAVALGGCTGTLIHPEIVVYAAHCGDQITNVWFGETYFVGEGRGVPVDFCMVNEVFELGSGNDYAFCKLAEPVLDIPFTPPLMGCETTLLTPGRQIALVGFGAHDLDGNANVKYELLTTLNFITEGGEAQTGDNSGFGVCFGDSGGPAYVRLDESVGGDGSWRAFGIASYINGGCGGIGHHTLIHNAVPFIEANADVDITPCHYPGGSWDPSAACQGFATQIDQSHGNWDNGCAGGELTALGATCGPPNSGAEDLVAPTARITDPEWGAVFESDEGGSATFSVSAEASDDASGVASVGLSVNGVLPDEAIDIDPPWHWPAVSLPTGVYTLRVLVRDHSGKETESEPVMIGVDMDPPEMPDPPEPASSSGAEESSSSGEPSTSTGLDATTGTPVATTDTDASTGENAMPVADEGACACRSDRSSGARWLWLLAFVALGRCRAARSARRPTSSDARRRHRSPTA
jgi:hypothetical protein